MKNIIKLSGIFFAATIFFSCHRNGDISIKVSDSDEEYKFVAHFDKSRTRDVQRFINKSIRPNGLFSGEDDRLNVDTKLQDGTAFKVQESPGELTIKIDKTENSGASVNRIRKMCDGLKKVLAD